MELRIECPVCGVRAFEDCYIRPNELYTIKYGPMMHVARIVVQKMDVADDSFGTDHKGDAVWPYSGQR